jgi:hypothetical protein
MCLIIYAKAGQEIPRSHFWMGAKDNADGIGIMSTDGVEKFLGRKQTRRAWRYAQELVTAGLSYAVHFRWATHGEVGRANTHPFEIPGSDLYMMHNGILWTAGMATDAESDTAIFARSIMPSYAQAMREGCDSWKWQLASEVDYSRLVLMDIGTGVVEIVNESLGDWLNGIWYSNLSSVPAADKPHRTQYSPAMAGYCASLARTPTRDVKRHYASGPNMGPGAAVDDDTDADAEWYYLAKARARHAEAGGKFDWHDRRTWDQYPIPGSWDDRHALTDETAGAPDDDDRANGTDCFV